MADRPPAPPSAVLARVARPDPTTTGLSWRPLTAEDTSAWHALVAAVEEHDDAVERHGEADLRELLLDGPAKDPASLSLVGVDRDGAFRAHAVVDADAEPVGEVRVQLVGGVHPAWRCRGVGRQLLGWQLAVARAHLARARHGLPARVGVHVEDGRSDLGALATSTGLEPLRWFRTLHRPFTDAPDGGLEAPVLPAGVRVVPWTPDLHEAVRLAHNEVFRDHWGSQPRTAEAWQRQVSGHRETRHDWSFVALDESGDPPAGAPSGVDAAPGVDATPAVDAAPAGGREPVVAGYVVSGAHPQDWAALDAPEGYTHLVGVRRPWRRRGLAPALLLTALRAYAADGMSGGALDVDADNPSGAAGLYERMGYRTRRRSALHALHLPPA